MTLPEQKSRTGYITEIFLTLAKINYAEEIHLSESQFKIFFNLRDKNNLLNQQNWHSREKVALYAGKD